jgi:hypothetical protein
MSWLTCRSPRNPHAGGGRDRPADGHSGVIAMVLADGFIQWIYCHAPSHHQSQLAISRSCAPAITERALKSQLSAAGEVVGATRSRRPRRQVGTREWR